MSKKDIIKNSEIVESSDKLYLDISGIITEARRRVATTVNTAMVQAYWHIGKLIVECQGGEDRAVYGNDLISQISSRLTAEYGKGFSAQNLRNMRQFYQTFPICQTLSSKLSWSHYQILMRIDTPKVREYYAREAVEGGWSVRQLERQIATQYYERLLSSQLPEAEIEARIQNSLPEKPEQMNPLTLIHDPFVLEFLGAREEGFLNEAELEKALLTHLEEFLLELGRGFAFMGRQKRITIDGDHFYPDLVFYNVITRNYVIIDLKMNKADYADIGQMQLYVNYFNMEVKQPDDNPTIGIVLCPDKNDAVVRYTLGNRNDIGVFAPKYKLYLPTEEELRREIERTRENFLRMKSLQVHTSES